MNGSEKIGKVFQYILEQNNENEYACERIKFIKDNENTINTLCSFPWQFVQGNTPLLFRKKWIPYGKYIIGIQYYNQ